MKRSAVIRITGIVQGIGFRPFVYRMAVAHGVKGEIRNLEDATVEVRAEGEENDLQDFISSVKNKAPKVASIQSIEVKWLSHQRNFLSFKIQESRSEFFRSGSTIPPDISICDECINDVLTRSRWHDYPFTCCAHCGPRYTAVYALPYDRNRTNMSSFPMCAECNSEYDNPEDRRFHAQGICCPKCGPKIALRRSDGTVLPGDPFVEAGKLIDEGFILAVKGIGGVHLAAKTTDDRPILRLRERRKRPQQPFAVMSLDVKSLMTYSEPTDSELRLLSSWQKPVVIVKKKTDFPLSELIAPGLDSIGVMLPYTGIHLLLLQRARDPALIMTSGNLPGLPMVTGNQDALNELNGIADYLLLHDRPIINRCDDSVFRFVDGVPTPVRRSRGYVPSPVTVPLQDNDVTVFAFGAELRNTGAILHGKRCYLTQHIGDTDNLETLNYLCDALHHTQSLFRIKSGMVTDACDLHPSYLTSRLAEERSLKTKSTLVRVQHHHAHIASVMAENCVPPGEDVVGIALDGVGYGDDGTVWGGEIMLTSYENYDRVGQLQPQPMPGGDLCTLYPTRMLIAILSSELSESEIRNVASRRMLGLPHGVRELEVLLKQLKAPAPPVTSSAGRFLDAVSAAAGICYRRTYEGEPAVKLEAVASGGRPESVGLEPQINHVGEKMVLKTGLLMTDILNVLEEDRRIQDVCAAAERALALGVARMAVEAALNNGIRTVGLSGGVGVNLHIVRVIRDQVVSNGLNFIQHREVPSGDGGISLGQSVVAAVRSRDM